MTRFVIEVVVDPRKAVSGSRKVRKELGRTETSANKLGTSLRRAFSAAVILAGVTAGIRVLASFSQEMSTVAAITSATEKEFKLLEERAISLGTQTRFSATQAAEGMSFLARAGFNANEVFATIDDSLNLAQAGALGLGQAADIASNALTAFRLDTSEAGRVVDVLAAAANSSNTTVAQLGNALKLVAPVAAGLGVEIEETTAAISALSNAGLQATLAGTGLRRVLSELESPSSKTTKILRELGLSTSDVRISSVGLTNALEALADAGVDTGLALELFGDRGGPAFEVLRSSIDDVRRFTRELKEADGTAERIAKTMDDNLNGSLLALRSAFEGLTLRLGQAGATGAIRGFVDALTTGLRATASITISTFEIIGGIIDEFTEGLGGLFGDLDFLIGNTFANIRKETEGLLGFVAEIVDRTLGFLNGIAFALIEVFVGAGPAIGDIFFRITNAVIAFFETALDTTRAVFGTIAQQARTLGSGILIFFGQLGAASRLLISGQAEAALDFATDAVAGFGATLERTVTDIPNVFKSQLAQLASPDTLGQLDNPFEQAASDWGAAVRNGFLEGIDVTIVSDILGDIRERAAEVTAEAEAAAAALEAAAAAAASIPAPAVEGSAAGGAQDDSGLSPEALATLKSFVAARESLISTSIVLNELFAAELITLDEYTAAMDSLGLSTQKANTAGAGLAEGLEAGLARVTDVAGAAAAAVENAFANMEDAVVESLTNVFSFLVSNLKDSETSWVEYREAIKEAFKSAVDSAIADLTRLLIRQLIFKSLGGPPGFAHGGEFSGGSPILVGEEGPEIITARGAGEVIPAGETAARMQGDQQPTVNVTAPPAIVQVVNVSDPNEIPAGIESEGGIQSIMNVIRGKRQTIREMLG